MRRVAAAVVAALALLCMTGPSAVNAQVIVANYKCTQAEFDSCDAQFKVCTGMRQNRESSEKTCQCWTDQYMCYRDCLRFPPGWGRSCTDTCPPPSQACAPPEFVQTAGAASLAVSGAAVLLAAALTVWTINLGV